jgi:sporulation protein YlmC with PRC-barrel domain
MSDFLKAKQLIGLSVFTESGHFIGKITDFEVDATVQSILRYVVVNRENIFFKNQFIISAAEVLSLSAEKMLVRDELVKEIAGSKKEKMMAPGVEPSGVAMSKD